VHLKDEERYRLLHGPYEAPLVKRGFLVDAVRGKLPFGTFSNGLIPWPKARKQGKGESGGYILCGDLLRALENECGFAVSHHWGVSRATVGNWRRALELKGRTEGAQRLVDLGVELAKLPQSRKKIAEAARGRKLSRAQKSEMLVGIHRGWKERFEARRAQYRRTGRFGIATKSDPWIPEEEKLLPRLTTSELVRVLGRTARSIRSRRLLLHIRTRRPLLHQPWKEWEVKLLGKQADGVVAKRLGRSLQSVANSRRRLGIKLASEHSWTKEEEAIIGEVSDAEAARRLGRTKKAVQHRRRALGMVFFHVGKRREWTRAEEALVGTDTDAVIAKKIGRTPTAVATIRREKGIAPRHSKFRPWAREEIALLGTIADPELARKLNRSVTSVSNKRTKLNIAPGTNRRWDRAEDKLLGKLPDEEVAQKLGRALGAVRMRRSHLGIGVFQPKRRSWKKPESF
jgi:hypothetical protein